MRNINHHRLAASPIPGICGIRGMFFSEPWTRIEELFGRSQAKPNI